MRRIQSSYIKKYVPALSIELRVCLKFIRFGLCSCIVMHSSHKIHDSQISDHLPKLQKFGLFPQVAQDIKSE